jgi:hypothetical protein
VSIAGQPAHLEQHGHYVAAGRSKNPADRGALTCHVGFSGSSRISGVQLATALFDQLMPHHLY